MYPAILSLLGVFPEKTVLKRYSFTVKVILKSWSQLLENSTQIIFSILPFVCM